MADVPAKHDRITWQEWVGVGAGIAAVVVSFLPWFRLAEPTAAELRAQGSATWIPVWQGNFLAWFPTVLLLAVSVLLLWQRFGKPVQMLSALWLTLAMLALVMILLRWVTLPTTIASGFGLYLGILMAVGSGAAAFLAFREQQAR
ncbi:hypothetical protein [Kibdelosporangium phytohabitans]|uniref:Uncharacterized protein n=1 Tax=Kibdelosporangium phytohabitans TaxID=860235 RepID=A0A0N9HVJ5_9PSEU|nr:hypothetical protein [Kibdelosporangium phytohabitans]ALG06110.1 hypothetical protein AOZ06_03520 [Kibdelosporangium phytohabitans]MBE1465800.1 drug/metabolite transporter (DMT)-like permease [Kibdelosporangium phytohabitans]